MEGTCHKGVILGDVGKDHQLGTADGVAVTGEIGGALDGTAHHADGVHVDARLGGGYVDGGADKLGFRERLGNDRDEVFCPLCHAFLHECGKAADKVDAHGIRRTLERFGNL